MPRFVIDEDVSRATGKVLKGLGYEVKDIRDYGLHGAEDDQIYQFAQNNQAVLVTSDMGFGNILHFPIGSHFGIAVIHFPNEVSTKEINRQLVESIKALTEDDFKGNLVIIEPGRVRIRNEVISNPPFL